jgi:hypothetical protein
MDQGKRGMNMGNKNNIWVSNRLANQPITSNVYTSTGPLQPWQPPSSLLGGQLANFGPNASQLGNQNMIRKQYGVMKNGVFTPVEKRKYMSPFAKALRDHGAEGIRAEVAPFTVDYRVNANRDGLLEALAGLRPVYRKQPKYFALVLLQAAAGPCRAMSFAAKEIYLSGVRAGLVMSYAPMIGVRRQNFRITNAGIAVLDEWAKRYPSFKPFVDAYVNKDIRRKAACIEVDIALGVTPPDFAAFDEKFAKNEQRILAEAIKKQTEALEAKLRYEGAVRTNRMVERMRYLVSTCHDAAEPAAHTSIAPTPPAASTFASTMSSASHWIRIFKRMSDWKK